MLRDRSGQTTARFDRIADTHRPAAPARGGRAVGLPAGLVALEGDELVGAWQAVHRPSDTEGHPGGRHGARFQNVEFTARGWWIPSPRINIGSGRWLAGLGGALLAVYPELGRTGKAMLGWAELDPWLLPVARAGFDGALLVLFDDHNHELQRLRRLDSRVGQPDEDPCTGE